MKKKPFTILVEDYNVTLQPLILWNQIFGKETYKLTGRKISIDSLFVFERDYFLWGPRAEQFIAAGNYFNKKIGYDPEFLNNLFANTRRSFREIEIFIKKLSAANLSAISNKRLLGWYKRFRDLWVECGRWGVIPMYMDMSDEKISERIKNSITKELRSYGEPEIIFSRLVTSLKNTHIYKEQIAVLRLLVAWRKNEKLWLAFLKRKSFGDLPKEMQAGVGNLIKRFGWMQYYYDGQAGNTDYYFDLLKRHRRNPGKELSSKLKEKMDLKKWQQKVLSGFPLAIRKEILMLQNFGFFKELRKEVQVYHLNFAMQNWFLEVGRRLYCTASRAKYLTPQEIQDWLAKGKRPSVEQLNSRYENCAALLINRKEKIILGQAAKNIKKLFLVNRASVGSIKEIKGSVAYPGRAKGLVKIVNSLKDLDKFNEGDILVSFATNPSLVSAMNKAAAIITNTGGITCHAAIVSREMKIPCVIGTKIATKILKDGDLIEVDANMGIIRKL